MIPYGLGHNKKEPALAQPSPARRKDVKRTEALPHAAHKGHEVNRDQLFLYIEFSWTNLRIELEVKNTSSNCMLTSKLTHVLS
eukprot:15216713-Heterocapsa_arctica.AAC.1